MKCAKRIMSFIMAVVMCFGMNINTMAAERDSHLPEGWKSLGLPEESLQDDNQGILLTSSAPSLSSVSITDLTLDENNEIHIEVKVMGTAKSVLCWCNGHQCEQNYNEIVSIVSNSIVVGTYRYFHTGIYYSDDVVGTSLTAKVQAINAMSPWNTLTATRTFEIP